MNNKIIKIFLIFPIILIMSQSILNAENLKFHTNQKYYLDKSLQILLSVSNSKLKIEILNIGNKPIQFSSEILNMDNILTNNLTIAFINLNSTRSQKEEFQFFGDGVITEINSRIFRFYTETLNPNEVKSVEIDLVASLNQVNNKRLAQYLLKNTARFSIHLRISPSSLGLEPKGFIQYRLPDMQIIREEKNTSSTLFEIHPIIP